MTQILLVGLGGALGAIARYLWVGAAVRAFGIAFPWGTLGVNVVGSALMGVAAAWLAGRAGQSGLVEPVHLFLGVGVLGGFTTFSAFSLDAVRLLEAGATASFLVYVGASVALSVGALAITYAAARHVLAGAL